MSSEPHSSPSTHEKMVLDVEKDFADDNAVPHKLVNETEMLDGIEDETLNERKDHLRKDLAAVDAISPQTDDPNTLALTYVFCNQLLPIVLSYSHSHSFLFLFLYRTQYVSFTMSIYLT